MTSKTAAAETPSVYVSPPAASSRWRWLVRHHPWALAVTVAGAAALIAVSEATYRKAADALEELTHITRTRMTIQHLVARTIDAETAQRGYLLTGQPVYLRPYHEAQVDISDALMQLEKRYRLRGDAPALEALAAIRPLVQARMNVLVHTIELERAGQKAEALAVINSGEGKRLMEAIRAHSQTLQHIEEAQLADGRQVFFKALSLNRVGVALMTLLALVALVLYVRQSLRMTALAWERAERLERARQRLEREVAERTAELTELATHLQTAREDERHLLARELHDELGAILTTAKLSVTRIRSKSPEGDAALTDRLAHLMQTLNSGIALKRRIIEDLHPSALHQLGLLPALDVLAREAGERMEVPITLDLHEVNLSPMQQLTVYRLVQEALTNAAKYAQAKRIDIALLDEGPTARVEIQDDGRGFDPSAPTSGVHGLLGMQYRVQAAGGELEVISQPGQGTLLRVRLPQQPDGPTSQDASLSPAPIEDSPSTLGHTDPTNHMERVQVPLPSGANPAPSVPPSSPPPSS